MGVLDALIASVEDAGWSPTLLAATVGVSEAGAKKWLSGESVPGGDTVIVLMRALPGFCDRLGFTIKAAA